MVKVIKAFLILFSIPVILGFSASLFKLFQSGFIGRNDLLGFGIGGIIFVLIWFFYLSRREGIWSSLEHELTHALFAVFFLKRIHSISASRKRGGLIRVEGGNTVIALAPYAFPLAAVSVLIFKPFLQERFQLYLNVLLGFTFMFHFLNLLREFHPGQPDIRDSGFLFSICMVVFFNIFFLGFILSSLPGEWVVMKKFIAVGAQQSWIYLGTGFFILKNQISNIF